YFDIDWDVEKTANWLRKQGVDQLVYLDKDASSSFGLGTWRAYLERLTSGSSEYALERRRGFSYWLECLEKLRKLAQYCETLRIPIIDPQGPLVVVDVKQCKPSSAQQ